jgi:hypothetical protein
MRVRRQLALVQGSPRRPQRVEGGVRAAGTALDSGPSGSEEQRSDPSH